MKLVVATIFWLLVICNPAVGKEILCIPRMEAGETTSGDHLYERDKDLNVKNVSHIDFDKLTIVSVEGGKSKIVEVSTNLYKSVD